MDSAPSLDVIVGPMFSGKTTELIRRLTIFCQVGYSVLYINSVLDTRDESFSTHNVSLSTTQAHIDMVKASSIAEIFERAKTYDIIAIDEAQFFEKLRENVLHLVETLGKKVIVASLDGDHQRRPFGDVHMLLSVCDSVTKLYPICKVCARDKLKRRALFSRRILSQCDAQVLVGAGESYMPVCREHYL